MSSDAHHISPKLSNSNLKKETSSPVSDRSHSPKPPDAVKTDSRSDSLKPLNTVEANNRSTPDVEKPDSRAHSSKNSERNAIADSRLHSPKTAAKSGSSSPKTASISVSKIRSPSPKNSDDSTGKSRSTSRNNSDDSTNKSPLTSPKPTNVSVVRIQTPVPEVKNQSSSPRPLTKRHEQQRLKHVSTSPTRARSYSPTKSSFHLPSDRLNLRKWKQQRREIAKQEDDHRIYHENVIKIERLKKIAQAPSSYPTMHLQQERLRERHAVDRQRKVLKSFIPILRHNLYVVDRLANVKGVYDIKRMNDDFVRHTQIVNQHAVNKEKKRAAAISRPFILPKITGDH